MPNFFLDNTDLQFYFDHLDMKEIVEVMENNYEQAKDFNYAPVNYEDAMEGYRRILEMVGDMAGNSIAPRAADVDHYGATFLNGKVTYAEGTQKNLKQLSQADLMGMIFPRKYGGLNVPFPIYMMCVETLSRADASLMNIFGLQDIGDTINKFGDEDQKSKYIPRFCTGEVTGAMALTEPDAGSDLQAVKLQAYQNDEGKWFLRGVKRFITNGNAEVLLVLARSEAGSKDGRGLSVFACYSDESVKIRRIENKLGIHGSPTCEMQFNDTPCELVGQRKFGLIKYVFDLMYRARMGVSAQAMGISQAAYEEALKYAKEREQFGKAIYNIPAVANILLNMRVTLEANRALFYSAVNSVGIKEQTEVKIEKLKAKGESVTDLTAKLKQLTKMANLLTPMCKYILTESANKITYDAIQVHGGTGYMKEFKVERLARDARITNIYEGTSQLQIVACLGGVINDILGEEFDKFEAKESKGGLSRLQNALKEIRVIFKDCLKYVIDKKDPVYQDVAAKELVDLYSYLHTGYLLLRQAELEPRKVFIANRYILDSLASARKNAETIKSDMFSDLLHTDKILIH
jgi:3-(methylthio)propanoyl-CoA dehydrogenase